MKSALIILITNTVNTTHGETLAEVSDKEGSGKGKSCLQQQYMSHRTHLW
jgi:hypothetical protein